MFTVKLQAISMVGPAVPPAPGWDAPFFDRGYHPVTVGMGVLHLDAWVLAGLACGEITYTGSTDRYPVNINHTIQS